jgi:hypothetical protein
MLQHYTVMQVGYETTMCFSCFLIRCVCYWLTSYEIEVMLVLMSHRELSWAFFCFIQEWLAGTGCCILENHIDSCCRMDYNSYQLATLFIPSNSCISVAKRAGDVCLVSLAHMVVELQCSTKLFFYTHNELLCFKFIIPFGHSVYQVSRKIFYSDHWIY